MGDIVHLPIRRVGDIELGHQGLYTTIGTAQIILAEMLGADGVVGYAVLLRRDAFPDTRICTLTIKEPEKAHEFVTEMMMVIEGTLRIACQHMDALLNEGENMYGR